MPARCVLVDTHLAPSVDGNGGNHRSLQVQSLLQRAAFPTRYLPNIDVNLAKIGYRNISIFLRGVLETHQHPSGDRMEKFRRSASNFDSIDFSVGVLLWENTMNPWTAYFAHRKGIPLIAVPQNIESLVSRLPLSCLKAELRNLRLADHLYCISHRDQWLLKLLGVDAHCLPYAPAPRLEESLKRIRLNRAVTMPKDYVVLGSATNPPTKKGMQELTTWIDQLSTPSFFHLVGEGTESLNVKNRQARIHGYVSSHKLEDLLSRATAVIVHQAPTTGSLTRIVDTLVCGVPVLANFDALTSCPANLDGLYGYHTFDELTDLLAKDNFAALTIPRFPQAECDHFVQTVRGYLEQ